MLASLFLALLIEILQFNLTNCFNSDSTLLCVRFYTVIFLDELTEPVLQLLCSVTVTSREGLRRPPEDHVIQNARQSTPRDLLVVILHLLYRATSQPRLTFHDYIVITGIFHFITFQLCRITNAVKVKVLVYLMCYVPLIVFRASVPNNLGEISCTTFNSLRTYLF